MTGDGDAMRPEPAQRPEQPANKATAAEVQARRPTADGDAQIGNDAPVSPGAATPNEATSDDENLSIWQRLRHRIIPDPELDEDNRFAFSRQELTARLTTEDAEVAAEILAEAREISERIVEGRTDGAERRAATLQSATAIAGSFSLAGAGLLATDVHGRAWQSVIGLVLLWITVNLGLCGWRATQATSSRIHRWSAPRAQAILSRSGQTLAEARIDRSVDILRAAGWNARYARFKVTMLKRSSRHLVRATLGIPVLVAAVLAYSLTYSPGVGEHARPKTGGPPHVRRSPGRRQTAFPGGRSENHRRRRD